MNFDTEDIEDLLGTYERDKKPKPKPMFGEVIPDMSQGGSGIGGILGTLATIGGLAANLVPGGQVVGIPLAIGGGALKGADKGGLAGALMGAGTAGVSQATSAGLGSLVEGLKAPVDTGEMATYSSSGAPLTAPGIRNAPISSFSSGGSPLTIPPSPRTVGGS